LLLTAGIHGDELNGIAVLHRLAATVDPAKLAGTLTLVPGLNPPGLLQSTRQWTPDWSRSAPNLNRELPGKEGGSAIADFAGRLWSRLIRPNADSAVDLHTQSRGTAYMMYAFASTPRTRRMAELVASFDVKFDLNRYPYELSGGQQQTASIMRALAPKPEVLFLDEPFSALDFEMTLFIREKLQEVFMQTGTTMLLVSHDLEEAVYLADQVLLLTKRPTKVAEILHYSDARPRTTETLSEPTFIAAKKRSLEIFQREVRR
jgi:hypothetical protein